MIYKSSGLQYDTAITVPTFDGLEDDVVVNSRPQICAPYSILGSRIPSLQSWAILTTASTADHVRENGDGLLLDNAGLVRELVCQLEIGQGNGIRQNWPVGHILATFHVVQQFLASTLRLNSNKTVKLASSQSQKNDQTTQNKL